MKTGQMLFVAFGGIMLGAASTLAIQTGLVHYEVSLDIRPRTTVVELDQHAAECIPAVPQNAPQLSADPYSGAPVAAAQAWNSEPGPYSSQPQPATDIPHLTAPLDQQQVAEIVAVREQLNLPVSEKLDELAGPETDQASAAFASHLRQAAAPENTLPAPELPTLAPAETAAAQAGPLTSGLRVNGERIEPVHLR